MSSIFDRRRRFFSAEAFAALHFFTVDGFPDNTLEYPVVNTPLVEGTEIAVVASTFGLASDFLSFALDMPGLPDDRWDEFGFFGGACIAGENFGFFGGACIAGENFGAGAFRGCRGHEPLPDTPDVPGVAPEDLAGRPGDVDGMPAGDVDGTPAGDVDGMPAGDVDGMPAGDVDGMPAGDVDGMPAGDVDGMPAGDVDGTAGDVDGSPGSLGYDGGTVDSPDLP